MDIQWLEFAGRILGAGLVLFEVIALFMGIANAVRLNSEVYTAEPITLKARIKVFAVEYMWLSFIFSDALKVAFKVPNYPIRTGMLSFGGMVGYAFWAITSGNIWVAVGAGMLAALSLRAGAKFVLRRNEAYRNSLHVQSVEYSN